MITASHLPAHRNGFKFFTKSGGLNNQDITEVRGYRRARGLCRTNTYYQRAVTFSLVSRRHLAAQNVRDLFCLHEPERRLPVTFAVDQRSYSPACSFASRSRFVVLAFVLSMQHTLSMLACLPGMLALRRLLLCSLLLLQQLSGAHFVRRRVEYYLFLTCPRTAFALDRQVVTLAAGQYGDGSFEVAGPSEGSYVKVTKSLRWFFTPVVMYVSSHRK